MPFHVPRFGFGTQPAAQDESPLPGKAPRPLSVRDIARRTAMLREAAQVLDHLPEPGEALHALMTGRYDLTILLTVLIERQPVPFDHLRIGTLSLKQRNLYELFRLIDAGKVGRLTLLVSDFFKEHHKDVCKALVGELAGRSPLHRFASARSHAKVVCMDFGPGGKMVLEGSANLRTNSNREQFCLLHHAGLHDWHAGWLDELVAHGQSDESGSDATG
jgi:hypothetical protein